MPWIRRSTALYLASPNFVNAADKIVHDGEYNFLAAQHGDRWAKQDKEIDARLAEIRKKNGGRSSFTSQMILFLRQANRRLNIFCIISKICS